MVYLKEDGSVDVERINQLPLEEWMDMVGEMTNEQFEYFETKTPLNESNEPYQGVHVNYTMEEEIARGAVDIDSYLKNKRKKYGI